jgi:hypothetical protein
LHVNFLLGCIRQFSGNNRLLQHLDCGTCQSNGNAISQSSNPIAPQESDNKTIKEITIEIFLEKMRIVDTSIPDNDDELEMNGPLLPPEMEESRIADFIAMFGWAKRTNLSHPPMLPSFINFMTWLFHRGNEKGKSKSSAALMISHAEIYGTASRLFEGEAYWEEGIALNGGIPVFLPEQIPENWRVKGWIMEFATKFAAMQAKKNGVKLLSPDEKNEQLMYYLKDSENEKEKIKIIGDLNKLASNIINSGVDFSEMIQKTIAPYINVDGMIYDNNQKRAIVHACGRVGRGSFIKIGENNQVNIDTNQANRVPLQGNIMTAEDEYDENDFADFNEALINDEYELRDEERRKNRMEDENEEIIYNADQENLHNCRSTVINYV